MNREQGAPETCQRLSDLAAFRRRKPSSRNTLPGLRKTQTVAGIAEYMIRITTFSLKSIAPEQVSAVYLLMTDLQLFTQMASLSRDLKEQVADFIAFLKSRKMPTPSKPKRQAGLAKGLISLKPDFDEPLEDFADYR